MYKEMQYLRHDNFQFWKKLRAQILKLIDRGWQENRGSDDEKPSEPLKNAWVGTYLAARVAFCPPPISLNEMALATLG